MPLSAGGRANPTGLSSLHSTLMMTCALLMLWPPQAVVDGQGDYSVMRQDMPAMGDMAAMAAMGPEERRESMKEAALRGGTCGMDQTGNHSLDAPEGCTAELYALWSEHIHRCNCKPRETVISLHDADTPNMLFPTMAVVNRCSGWCSTMGHTCLATRTAPKTVTLFHVDVYKRMLCGVARVKEDTECSCGCPLTAADCSERQEFHADKCLCGCRKTAEYRRGCREGRRWDSRSCRCVCETTSECSTGFGWSNDYCRCLRMMMPAAGEDTSNPDSDNIV